MTKHIVRRCFNPECKIEEVLDVTFKNNAIFLRSRYLKEFHGFPLHAHKWNQLIYALSGTLVVTVEDKIYTISPEQAIWMPAGVVHSTSVLKDVEFRSLYIKEGINCHLPQKSTMFNITSFMRELIIELSTALEQDEYSNEYIHHLENVIIEKLTHLSPINIYLLWPKNPKLIKICRIMFDNLNEIKSLDEWACTLNVSTRSLHRYFINDIGISFQEWVNHLRVFKSIELLNAQKNVTDIALELGYHHPSSFTYMFKKRMGISPSHWLASLKN